MQKTHVFVTTVGVSDYVYAEIFPDPDEKMTNFVAGTVHALEYYDAIPRYLIPDNASTAVTKHTEDQLMINSTYQDLENFYGTVVLPPPAYKRKGKPTVEKHVQYLAQTADIWGDFDGTQWNHSGGKLVPERRRFGTRRKE